jgi:distribution and morphology protein 31
MDEIGAFFSWFVLGHVIWIIVGTTTFFSLAIFAVNTVFAQGNLLLCAYSPALANIPYRNIG